MASKKLEQLFLEFKKEAFGVKKDVPLWKKCLTKLSDLMTHAIGRLYVDKMFNTNAKKTMDKLVGVLNSTFGEMLENNTWMDEPTRNESLKKLQKMVAKIGYPSWILNDTYLNGLLRIRACLFSCNYSFLNVLSRPAAKYARFRQLSEIYGKHIRKKMSGYTGCCSGECVFTIHRLTILPSLLEYFSRHFFKTVCLHHSTWELLEW
uniref:Putative peptidase family m13 includes neprilysin n=1 Tax=Ixodes ricinus TaxID=34613 RepID=V5IJK9_IXORI